MRKNLNRVLACALSLALLITCSISGLVLPAMADSDAIVNLLEGKLAETYTVKPNSSAFPSVANLKLQNGERYVLRCEAKGSSGFVSFTDGNGAWRQSDFKDTGDTWRAYQHMFVANGANDGLTGQIKNSGTTNDLVVRNIELYRAPKDGSFDVMVGGNMNVETEFLQRQFDSAGGPVITTDPDNAENSVLFFSKDVDYPIYYNDIHQILTFDANMVYKFTFRMKGYLRFTSLVNSPTYLPNPDAVAITSNGDHTYFASPDGWSTFSFYIKAGANLQYLEIRNNTQSGGKANLWIDDFQIHELPPPSALTMNKTEVALYPGNNTQLSVITTPKDAYVMDGAISWSSSNPDAVSVDSAGNVKAATTAAFGTTATITAKYSNTVYATCVVTVDDGAPKPPAYTVPDVNGFKGIDTARVLSGGGEAVEILSNVLLKSNTRYALRYTTKSSAAGATISHNGGSTVTGIAATTEWQANQVLFKTTDAGATFKVTVTPSTEVGSTLQIKDIELWEAPADGTFNLLPASSCDAQSVVFEKHFAAGVTLADTDGTNKAMYWNKMYDCRWTPAKVFSNLVTTKMFKLTFRYKGNLRIYDGMSNDGRFLSYADATSSSGNGGSGGAPQLLYYSSTEWREATIIFDAGSLNQLEWMYLRCESGTLYLDDICLYECPAASALTINMSELALYPQNTEQLKVTPSPESAYLDMSRVTWKSSNPLAVTVDEFGNVKAVGTDGQSATITAMLDGQDAVTCVVTVDLTAPKPPVETEPGVNAMADVKDGTYTTQQQVVIKSGAILKAGVRYALRFTTKSNVEGVKLTDNVNDTAFTVPVTTNWRANQILFTPSAKVDHFLLTLSVPNGLDVQVDVKDWELYEAPADGTFNIIPGSNCDAETAFFTKHLDGNAAVLTTDPADATNSVLRINGKNYFSIKAIGGYQSGKVWKLTFRMKGAYRVCNWGSGATVVSQPDAYLVRGSYVYFASEDWKTVSYYIQPSGMSQAEWIEIGNYKEDGGSAESYIDDVQLYEMDASTSFSIVEQDLHLYPTSTQQLTYTWTAPGSILVGGDLEWSSSDTNVVLVDAKTGRITLVGDVGQTAVITAKNSKHTATTTITVDDQVPHAEKVTSITLKAPLGQDMDIGQQSQLMLIGTPADNLVGRTTWTTTDDRIVSVDAKGNIVALGAGTATVTGKTEFDLSVSIEITVYAQANLLINGDFEQPSSVSWNNSSNLKAGKGQYGSAGYVIQGESSTYYKQDIMLKPGTKYEISYRYKAEDGAYFRLYTGWAGGASNVTPSVFVEPGTIEESEWLRSAKVFTSSDFFTFELGWAFSLTTSSCGNEGDHLFAYIDNVAIREYVVGGPVETLAIDQQNITIAPGRSTKLTYKATPDPADTNTIVWTSSNEQVAQVVSGNVYGVGAGTATITATTKSGVSATTTVTVNGSPALLQNGSFETADDPATPENELKWNLSGATTYVEGLGVIRSNALELRKGGSFSQEFKGMKPDTAYQLTMRHILRNKNALVKATIKKKSDGSTVMESTIEGKSASQVTFQEKTLKLSFISPADVTEEDELILEIVFETGDEYARFDDLMIIEASSEVDLIVSDVTWSHDNADQVTPGTKLQFFVSVVNQGAEAYTGSKPFTIDILVDAQKALQLSYEGQVGVGEMLIVEAKADETWAATPGDHTITAVVNSTMTILENNDTNNHYSVNLRVAEEKDFVKAPDAAIAMGHNRLIFSDHFDDDHTIDNTASGNPGYKWYITRPWGESTLTAKDYRVEDGVLYVTTEKTSWNYSMCTVDAKKTGVGFSYNTGYMEIRLRMKETAEGGTVTKIRVPAVWSFSDDTIWGTRPVGKDSLELDWIEYWGNKYGKPRFDTTLHHSRVDKETGASIGKVTSGQTHYEPIGDYQWHTYAMGWSHGILKTYFDGELVGTQKYSKDGYPDPLPTGSINVEAGGADPFEGTFSILDEQNMTIILGGASDFPLEVDWIHIWQSDGSIEPQEDVDRTPMQFVNKYLRDNGALITELTADNYQKILSGETAYLSMTAEQQAAVDAAIGTSYLSWISEIYSTLDVVNNFVSFYACAEDGTPYTVVDGTNAAWIAGSVAEWDTLTDFAKALINAKVLEQSGMSFDDLLAQALAYDGPLVDNHRNHGKTNWNWVLIPIGVMGALIVAGGVVIAILLFVKKKKKNEQPQ